MLLKKDPLNFQEELTGRLTSIIFLVRITHTVRIFIFMLYEKLSAGGNDGSVRSLDASFPILRGTEWNLSPLFLGDNDPRITREQNFIQAETTQFIGKWQPRTDYLENPQVLAEAMGDFERWVTTHNTRGDSGLYFDLRSKQDQSDPEIKAKAAKINENGKRILNQMRFFTFRIAHIPKEKHRQFLDHEGLSRFRHYLEREWVKAEYLLTEPEERILTLKEEPARRKWIEMTEGLLSREEREVTDEEGNRAFMTYARLNGLTQSRNKSVRDEAGRAINDIVEKRVDVAEVEINAELQDKKVDDELRGYPRPDSARHIEDDIDSKVVDAMVGSVSSRNDIARRYYELKAKLLGQPKLGYHERNVEYGDLTKTYTPQESVDTVYRTLVRLDPEFGEIFAGFVNNGQLDMLPRAGKNSGASCTSDRISSPSYLLLNHTGRLNDITTLAHETGHGVNNTLMGQVQNELNYATPTSTAEVASTFMEDFVLQDLLNTATDEERLAILMMKLNGDVSSIFRQVACYRFEQELHGSFREKGYLSKEEIGMMFKKHMEAYMGDAVELSEGFENWWVGWPHIRDPFYVYSYASGLLISKSLQAEVKKDIGFVQNVKEFLSAGTSDSPKNIFAQLGIDISDEQFWKKGLDEIEFLLQETEALAKKLGKISS